VEHQVLVHANDAVVRAAHSHVCLERCSARKYAFICGGDVGVGTEDCGDFAVEVPAHGDFFAGGFGVEVDHDDFGLDAGEQVGGGMERVVGPAHEDLAHEVEYCVRQTLVGSVGDGPFENAIAGESGLHICRAEDAAWTFLAVGWRGEVVEQFSFVPHVIAGGHDVGTEVEELIGDLRGHAEAASGVFDIHDGEVDFVGLAQMADVLAHNSASRAAEDVADEEDVQEQLPAFSSFVQTETVAFDEVSTAKLKQITFYSQPADRATAQGTAES
jgi:hypothetical protein